MRPELVSGGRRVPDPGLPQGAPQLSVGVPSALDGERLDRGVAMLAGVTRAQAARLVSAGRARLAGAYVQSGSRRLRSGELLEVWPLGTDEQPGRPPASTGTVAGAQAGVAAGRPEAPAASVVYVDEHLVVVDKPAGLVVHPGAGNTVGTLVHQLVAMFPDMALAGPADRPGIVHRLDKGTSGLLVVARTEQARSGLVAQMAARSAHRRYLAVVHGMVEADQGLVEAPVGRSQSQRLKMAVVQGGRQARTGYRALGRSGSPMPVTLVACRLETGRTHQVRVHMAAIGHPLLGDPRYGRAGLVLEEARVLPELGRPWLHAAELGFVHPLSGEALHFSSVLPDELLASLPVLGLPLPPVPLP